MPKTDSDGCGRKPASSLVDRRWEQAHRRLYLQEPSYTLPEDGRTALYDWQTLYLLWCAVGFVEQFSGHPVVCRKVAHVDRAFQECTRQLALRLVRGLQSAIGMELQHLADEHLIPPKAVLDYAEGGGPITRLIREGQVRLPDRIWSVFTYNDAAKLFLAPFWQEHADLYGGPRWAAIAGNTGQLHSALKHGRLMDLVESIRQLFEAGHDTGPVFGRLAAFKISYTELRRLCSGQTEALVDYASPFVRNLVATTRIMKTSPSHAKVGIFWVFRGKLYAAAVPVKEGVQSVDAINGQADHVSYWPQLQRLRPELRGLEYEQVPRGRVLFLKATGKFCVYMDNVLHKPRIKQVLLKEFCLPKDQTKFLDDPHYVTDAKELARLFTD